MSLEVILQEKLKQSPLSLADYMELCLQHPLYGYYRSGNPLGKQGDFMTAPEISPLFGELWGSFLASQLPALGITHYHLCELGAGRGTLMRDIKHVLDKYLPAKSDFIFESNDFLKAQQKQLLSKVNHLDDLSHLPKEPICFIANEFFDALPIQMYQLCGDVKYRMMVGKTHQGYGVQQGQILPNDTPWTQGTLEESPESQQIMRQLCQHLKAYGGMIVICDYGYVQKRLTPSFRGYYRHQVTDGFSHIGDCDLTADVDFQKLSDIALHTGCIVLPVITQKQFLERMYIDIRLEKLLQSASQEQKSLLISGKDMLCSPQQMGDKFKFLCVTQVACDIYPFIV